MAASMWRMNGLWGRMAGGLVLCTLFLSNEVMCQENSTSMQHNATAQPVRSSTAPATGPSAITVAATSSAAPSAAGHQTPASQQPQTVSTTTATTESQSIEKKISENLTPSDSDQDSAKSTPSVFVGILVSGLVLAAGLIGGYCKCQHKPDTKEVKRAEEAYPADQENQGNTLESEAPLNPPPETQEKPNVNGESPEAPKTQPPPPTNGHSTTKTADTEL